MVILRDGDGSEFSKVSKRLKYAYGLPIVCANDNSLLDTCIYEVDYSNGHKASLTANAIATNIFAKVNAKGI